MTNIDNTPYSVNSDDCIPDLAPWSLDENQRNATDTAVFTDASLEAVLLNVIS